MLRLLLDTNLCVRALRDRPIAIRERMKAELEHVCISAIVRYELYVGVAGKQTMSRASARKSTNSSVRFPASTSMTTHPSMPPTFASRCPGKDK